MATIDLKSLVLRLNPQSRSALEGAAGLALSNTHYLVEVEHWLTKLLNDNTTDIPSILGFFEINLGRVQLEINKSLERHSTGNTRPPGLSPDIVQMTKDAWLIASIEDNAARVRSGHLLRALLSDKSMSERLGDISPSLAPLSADLLKRDFAKAVANSSEDAPALATQSAPGAPSAASGDGGFAQYTVDLTAEARAGRIDPILGRDEEIRQVIDILTRRRQNNPILTGEAGVGKTALVEGLAQRVAKGDVPEMLKNVEVRTLDLGLLQAGASAKGEFESRLRSVIDEVKQSPIPVVLFVDEAHTLIGAGGQAGQGDAANLLKPALARGELRMIAATTWAEYKKYFEKDVALTRRFQIVKIDEPSEPVAAAMLRAVVPVLESFHKVLILEEAVQAAVKLSARYIPARQLPDKAVSLLDTACSRVAISQTTTPPALEDRAQRVLVLSREIAMLEREQIAGSDCAERIAELTAERSTIETEIKDLRVRFDKEKECVAKINAARTALTDEKNDAEIRTKSAEELHALEKELSALQNGEPLVFPLVDAQVISTVVQNWTGIPAGRLKTDEIQSVLALEKTMEERIVGQSYGLSTVSKAIFTSRAKLTDPRKPLGVFLLVGTSGVGKTETALTLADLLYGGEQNLTTINMSEFKEEHKVSLLMGSPPGYVGYGEGGILTEAVRRKPHSVILLDEMEKAHPGVQDVFYQVFDKGQMKDGEGRDIDFRNSIIMMASNAASDTIEKLCADPANMPTAEELGEAIRPELLHYFKAAFLGRVTLVPYLPLPKDKIRTIVSLQLRRIEKRVQDTYGATFIYTPALADQIAVRCIESGSGARNIENILSRTVLPEMSSEILRRLAEGLTITSIHVDVTPEGRFTYEVM